MGSATGPVVVGYDGSDQARDALALGRLLGDAGEAELVVARVFPLAPWHAEHTLPRDRVGRAREAEEELVLELEAVAESEGARAEPMPARSAARGLHELAEELRASVIVVGSAHTASVGSVLVGSTGDRLLHGAPCAVAVAAVGTAGDEDLGLRVIGAAYDGSPEATMALERAIDLARRAEATMRIFTVVAPEGGEQAHRHYERQLAEAREVTPPELRAATALLHGDPARALAEEAGKGVNLMVLGSRGYGPVGRVLLGGVSIALVRMAPCSLLIVKTD